MTLAIDAQGLTKKFTAPKLWRPGSGRGRSDAARDQDHNLAVDHVTFQVRHHEIFGLLGPNGAGKTTLVKMLSTLILPTEGTAHINGIPISQVEGVKASIGLMTHNERSFFPRLTCNENLRFYGGLAQLTPHDVKAKIVHLAEMLDLAEHLDKRYDHCSTGIKHRLALARALLNDANLLLLDEPTATLDPVAAAQFRERLYALVHQEARTVLMVTHNVDEAVALCDHVGVMVNGRMTTVGKPEQLRDLLHAEATCVLQLRGDSAPLRRQITALADVETLSWQSVTRDVSEVEVKLRDRRRSLPLIISAIEAGGGIVDKLQLATASWEQVTAQLGERQAHTAHPERVSQAMAHKGQPSLASKRAAAGTAAGKAPRRLRARQPASGGFQSTGARFRELQRALPLFLARDWRIQVSYRLSFLLQMTGIFFSIASFYFVAQVFGDQASPFLAAYGGDYFSFVLIGIAFLGYQSVALYGFSSVVQSAQTTGTLEAMLTTRTRLSTILVGSSAWNFIFTSFRVVLYLLAGILIFQAQFNQANFLGALLVLILSVISLSAIGILSASFIMVYKRGSPINFLISSVSTLLGGAYYPIEVLPEWLQRVARLYPLTTSLQAMRRALLTGASLRALSGDLAILATFSALLLPISMMAFSYAVERAKRDGSLTQF